MPIDRGLIDQQLQALQESSAWWDQRELRDLPAVLHADEHILALARGKVARVRVLRRSWLIVVTDQRLLCMRSSGRTSWRQFEVNASQISRVALRVGLFRGRVLVSAGGQTYSLLVARPDAYKLEAALMSIGTPARGALTGFGPTRIVRRVMDHVLALPAVALDPQTPAPPAAPKVNTTRIEQRLQAMEDEIQQLRDQVDFLEELLRKRQGIPAVSGPAESYTPGHSRED